MQHMIQPMILSGPLEGHNILGAFHHADDSTVPGLIPADGTQLTFGKALADLASFDFLMGFQDGIRKLTGLSLGMACT